MDHFYHTGARKADGSVTPPYDEGTVFDPECQCRREKSELLHATTTYKLPADYFRREREERTPTPESSCTLNLLGGPVYMEPVRIVGRENVLGYEAVVLERARSHDRLWLIPSLGCHIVGSENTAFDRTGRVLQINRHRAVRITPGEPPRELFAPIGDERQP